MTKTNGCIKTGAKVRFIDHDRVVSCDLYRVGNCIVIRANLLSMGLLEHYAPDVTIQSNGGRNEFWRDDLSTYVVPEEEVYFHKEM